MPSISRTKLTERLRDIEQLIGAHTAITKFKKAEDTALRVGGELKKIADVIDALVTDPGRGKPKEVDAINRASFVLLTAHFRVSWMTCTLKSERLY